MAQFPNRASSAVVRSGALARIFWSDSGVAVQCCRDRAASIGVAAGEMAAPLRASSPTSWTTRCAKAGWSRTSSV